jgi:hypothetical protein
LGDSAAKTLIQPIMRVFICIYLGD